MYVQNLRHTVLLYMHTPGIYDYHSGTVQHTTTVHTEPQYITVYTVLHNGIYLIQQNAFNCTSRIRVVYTTYTVYMSNNSIVRKTGSR
jgi:hypothetical protein